MTHIQGFVNPLGRNPFLCPKDANGLPKLTEAELEIALRAYCRLWAIPVGRGKTRCKAIPKPSGSPVCGSPTIHLIGQQELIP